jgi:spore coat polysaccharide biosynthesis predicted glycosyltransferase SpsG
VPVVIVRCDGNAAIGMGHVSRCLALGEALRDRERCFVIFAMRGAASAGAAAVRAAGFEVAPIMADESADYGGELDNLVSGRHTAALVVDVRDGLTRNAIDAIRQRRVRIVSIDDGTDRRLAADLVFYPPVPQVEQLNWPGFTGRRYVGWEWVMLRREFSTDTFTSPELSDSSPAIDVLVTMGGSDPMGMTEFAVRALALLPMPLAVHVVVGPAFSQAEPLIDTIVRSKHSVQIARAPASLAPLMRASRMALASFGVSAFELAACGVPAVHLCLTADHARASGALDRAGVAMTAGVFGEVTAEQLARATQRLMGSAGRRGEMARRARQLVDGRGAERVAALVSGGLS